MVKSPETVWKMPDKELLHFLNESLVGSKLRRVRFYVPSFIYYKTAYYCSLPTYFPTISVTGKSCALKCKHCGGKVLETMYPATTPEALYNLCRKLKAEGALGCLISGGCLPDGSVPLDRFIEAIRQVKADFGLAIFAHVGVVNFERALRLKEAGVDAALIDILGSDETIKEVCNLDLTVKSYENALEALSKAGLTFIPHVIVGLHYGKLLGEFNALQMISRYRPSALVIIAFMPIHGTDMANVEPPRPLDIARVLAVARMMFPRTPIALGCMRPKGEHRAETDVLAIKAGVDAIAFPDEKAVDFALKQGFEISFSSYCCSQIYVDSSKT
jgi:uncharacterized radical SAM superfamily protein